jgi:hypothetical protein
MPCGSMPHAAERTDLRLLASGIFKFRTGSPDSSRRNARTSFGHVAPHAAISTGHEQARRRRMWKG